MPVTANADKARYYIGDVPFITGLFRTAVGNVLTSPTTTTVILVDPTGAQTTTATPNAAITVNTGVLTYIYPISTGLPTAGVWSWRVKGVGAVIAACEGSFEVRPSLAVTP